LQDKSNIVLHIVPVAREKTENRINRAHNADKEETVYEAIERSLYPKPLIERRLDKKFESIASANRN
jgi:hypothetical protein